MLKVKMLWLARFVIILGSAYRPQNYKKIKSENYKAYGPKYQPTPNFGAKRLKFSKSIFL